jgi:hypothetical protein
MRFVARQLARGAAPARGPRPVGAASANNNHFSYIAAPMRSTGNNQKQQPETTRKSGGD